ncbi:MAG: type II toxin-antitoxin system RelE/ParE family toxin [Treponema sp.]|nr:type II toxin-antitoxin system RelE/ParE family toxin [Treponema sp.]
MIEEIKYLPSFQHELNAIVDYISIVLEAPRAALNLINELDIEINKLKTFPNAHRLYRPVKPIKTPYRIFTVGNYLVFYVVLDEYIEIHRIIYKKRNLSQLIK